MRQWRRNGCVTYRRTKSYIGTAKGRGIKAQKAYASVFMHLGDDSHTRMYSIVLLEKMKAVFFTFLVATIVVVQCNHLFLGTNVNRPMVHHQRVERSAKVFRKGILVIDSKGTEASANVTDGGVGFTHCNVRMKSERGRGLHYDIYIYA
ncbi:Uncharacterized protein OBRU01_15707 [Operophtera brumata]|uniref:Uncharacterized protein n=1 Tax=Operophtera brumata TaxID=104452 RepID=A0A0L7L4F2_OPEBR|nr:Uncharacterized protein OBRU01_15707 [Operophtera brumata]